MERRQQYFTDQESLTQRVLPEVELRSGLRPLGAGLYFGFETSAAALGKELGLQVNAGHGLTYANVSRVAAIPGLAEFNIGHSIISHAVTVGLKTAVQEMLRLMASYRG